MNSGKIENSERIPPSGLLLVMLIIVAVFVTAGIYVLTGSPAMTLAGLVLAGLFLACLLLLFRGGRRRGRRG